MSGLSGWLPWIHPAWMLGSLALAGLALRSGLAIRRRRLRGEPRPPELRRRHLRRAKRAAVLVLIGFCAGPVSAVYLRDWEAFASFHGAVGALTAALFTAAAWLGRRLERGRSQARDLHALIGATALLFGALAAVAGFVLLP